LKGLGWNGKRRSPSISITGIRACRPSSPSAKAKSRGQILAIAFEHGVKVREDADLVEILSTLEVGDEIPIIAFAAVAEILTHVYRWELQQRSPSEHSPT